LISYKWESKPKKHSLDVIEGTLELYNI